MSRRYDVEHDCEDNTFIATNLSRADADRYTAELEADDTVTNVKVVDAP